jgi:membrane protein DedA with SNARE-associated domain
MTATVPRTEADETSDARDRPEMSDSARRAFIIGAVLRTVLALAAIPLAPALYRDHVAVLVLLRPTKDVFLFSGFALREGDTSLPAIVVVALPMLLAGVWIFYGLGRAYARELDDAELPGVAGRLLPKRRIDQLRDVLEDRGMKVVFLGRLAAFPSTLMAAAAGASGVGRREFLVADTCGALLSMAVLVGVGFGLGEAYEDAGPWVTLAGVVVLFVLLTVLGRALLRPSTGGTGGTATRKARGRLSTRSSAGASKVSPSAARRSGPSSDRTVSESATRSS